MSVGLGAEGCVKRLIRLFLAANLYVRWDKEAVSLFGNCLQFQRESEAPAELGTPRFGRSLTLPSNELVE